MNKENRSSTLLEKTKINKKYIKNSEYILDKLRKAKKTKLENIQNCKQMIMRLPRKVVFLYSNPTVSEKFFQQTNLSKLNALSREMRYVISLLNPFDFIMQPATTFVNFKEILQKFKPEIIVWSGHTLENQLIFESESGKISPETVNAQECVEILKNTYIDLPNRLKVFVLMGCNTDKIGDTICQELNVHVICWSTVTEDNAAAAFTSGIIHYIRNIFDRNLNIDADIMFAEGLNAFKSGIDPNSKQNFQIGNPIEQLQQGVEIPNLHGIPLHIKPSPS